MKLLVWLVLLITVLWIFFPRPGVGRFRAFEVEAHPYSGLDPNEWKSYLNELRAFDVDPSKPKHLYTAIEHLRNLGLMNTNYTETINEISDRLGYEGEIIASQTIQGVAFRPKYLNDIKRLPRPQISRPVRPRARALGECPSPPRATSRSSRSRMIIKKTSTTKTSLMWIRRLSLATRSSRTRRTQRWMILL